MSSPSTGPQTSSAPEFVKLVGQREENIYQLGLKDRGRHKFLVEQAKNLISAPGLKALSGDEIFHEGIKAYMRNRLENLAGLKEKVRPYVEGLNDTTEEDIIYSLLIPELSSSLSYWIPQIPSSLFGCSSFFTLDSHSGELLHGRILDFPLKGSFDTNERVLFTEWEGGPKILSFGTAGFPFPSITAMTNRGISLALHQKFTDVFNPQGVPIFEFVDDFLNTVKDIPSALEFLRNHQTLTTWSLYIGFDRPSVETPKVLEVDVMGSTFVYRQHELKGTDVLHFHNQLVHNPDQSDRTLPLSIDTYNEMRALNAQKKTERLQKKKKRTPLGLLKEISSLEKVSKNKKSTWSMDSITLSSLTAVVMSPGHGSFVANHGEAPKFFQNQTYEGKNFWHPRSSQKIEVNITSSKNSQKKYRHEGWRDVMLAQVEFDRGEIHGVFHHLQMASHNFERANSPLEETFPLFYLYVFQYMYEKHHKRRVKTMESFRTLLPNLPSYFQDHAILFINRLERILKIPPTHEASEISHPVLRKVFEREENIPDFLFYPVTSKAMIPRMDIMDIIYLHFTPKDDVGA